jgi:hypothetical protein
MAWGMTRTLPTTVMKLMSPLQRGTMWAWMWPGTPAPAHLPTLKPMEINHLRISVRFDELRRA